ncbi:HAAS signaling domain-containing protein [Catenulispora subtropica]|uniref:Uncharacterized protein n=1 Tax=Catenulispora subtropica TaxID=450798 RepID=A0ABP5E6F2_9ACTN
MSEGLDGRGGSEGFRGSEGPEGVEDFEDEVTAYAAEVRAQLADLPLDEGAELWEDLEDHLREVAAEGAGTLRQRLGEPAVYAAELRQAAGLPEPGETAARVASPGLSFWQQLRRSARATVRDAERRIRATRAGHEVLTFLPSLRPAWWVLRAWVVVRLLEVWTADVDAWHDYSTVPKIGDNRLLGFVALAVAIPTSVYLGRRGLPGGWRRRMVFAAEGVLGVVAFGALVAGIAGDEGGSSGVPSAPWQVSYAQQQPAPGGLSENGKQITNLWVYDKDGKPLDGVFVYDQDGQPVRTATTLENGSNRFVVGDTWVDAQGQLVANRYPLQLLQTDWYEADNTPHYVTVPPPTVAVPQGVHRPSGATPSGASPTPTLNPDSPSPSVGATSATATPGGATPAQGSPQPSAPPSTPAQPGAKG